MPRPRQDLANIRDLFAKHFQKRLEKISVNIFPSYREEVERAQTDPRLGPHEGPLQSGFEPNWPVPEEEAEGGRVGRIRSHGAVSCSFMQGNIGYSSSMVLGVSTIKTDTKK